MWDLYLAAKTFNARPSDLMGVQDLYAAYCLDTACGEWGRAIEGALEGVEGKTKKEVAVKSERVLRKWLGMAQRYRDPARAGAVTLPSEEGQD
jgi:hypothetical protein